MKTQKKLLSLFLTALVLLSIVSVATVSAKSVSNVFNTIDIVVNENTVLEENSKEFAFPFVVTEAGAYNFSMSYRALDDSEDPIEIALKIDDVLPFSECENLSFGKLWIDDPEDIGKKDSDGNEITPDQILYSQTVTKFACDNTGKQAEPYVFNLDEGKHILIIRSLGEKFLLEAISFLKVAPVENYSVKSEDIVSPDCELVVIEAEKAYSKSTKYLVPISDQSSPSVSPASTSLDLLNCIGSTNWQMSGETLTWSFVAPQSGHYKLGFMFKQDGVINGSVYRHLKIDGVTPFSEAANMKFGYSYNWDYKEYIDENGEPYAFYLDEGEHKISLEVTLGEIRPFYNRLSEIVADIGELYLSIIMITGDSPDRNRDYELFRQIPDFDITLKENYNALKTLASEMKKVYGKRGSNCIAAFNNMARVLQNMINSPYDAQDYLKDYYSNYSTVSSWLYDMSIMPLTLDRIMVVPYDVKSGDQTASFGESLLFSIKKFLVSFTTDYNTSSNSSASGKSITLWVNWGNDQVKVLKSLIQDSFTAETGIDVNLVVTNASLIKGLMVNDFPDLSLHMSRTEPINLAMRGALYDLTNFSDFQDVLSAFQKGAETPYRYNEGCYALPDTQTFFAMYYRTDIFERLKLEVPNTWDEFIDASVLIQRNGMEVYVPYTSITSTTTVNVGIGGLNLFPTLMMQNGLSLYNDSRTATDLKSATAISVFTKWTELYTKYKYVKAADFYNRFRVGTMPLGICEYTIYNRLKVAAPEISGHWKIALVPGVLSSEGTINRTISGGGSGAVILKRSKHKDEAWEFLKWWTSADIQAKYSQNIESRVGATGRVATANVDAFSKLAWDKESKLTLLEQWSYVRELPEVPGGYYLSRSIDQAYWEVINGGNTPKDALTKWSDVADLEIARKIAEYPVGKEK